MKAIDVTPALGGMCCGNCGRVKPASQFNPARRNRPSWCAACYRIDCGRRNRTAATKAREARRGATERRKEYLRVWHATRRDREAMAARAEEYRATERGKLVGRRNTARYRLRHAASREVADRQRANIDRLTAAIAALDAEDE